MGLRLVAMFLSNFFQQGHRSFHLPLELLQVLLLLLQQSFLPLQLRLQLLLRQERNEDKKSRDVHGFLDTGKLGAVQ